MLNKGLYFSTVCSRCRCCLVPLMFAVITVTSRGHQITDIDPHCLQQLTSWDLWCHQFCDHVFMFLKLLIIKLINWSMINSYQCQGKVGNWMFYMTHIPYFNSHNSKMSLKCHQDNIFTFSISHTYLTLWDNNLENMNEFM